MAGAYRRVKSYNPDNPFAQPDRLEQLLFLATGEQLGMLEFVFEESAFAFSCSAAQDTTGHYKVEIICDAADVDAMLAQTNLVPTQREILVEHDWVAQVQADFKPMRAGRFYVYGSHVSDAPPHGTTPILMDAGAAFGTGEHATTSSCLQLLSRCKMRPKQVLDIGCGTGILAIGAAKIWPDAQITASDYCPTALRVTRENLQRNHVQWRVQTTVADGTCHATIQRRGRYDLVLANILAHPLIEMAPAIRRVSAPGGVLILSGLLNRQETKLLNAYRAQGFSLIDSVRQDGWSGLMLRG